MKKLLIFVALFVGCRQEAQEMPSVSPLTNQALPNEPMGEPMNEPQIRPQSNPKIGPQNRKIFNGKLLHRLGRNLDGSTL